MRILWVKSDFLHPTTRGGQIRTLEMMKQLHRSHEIHYVAFDDAVNPEGRERAPEYCSFAYPVRHHVASKRSLAFAGQLVRGLFSPIPVAGMRYASSAMSEIIAKLTRQHKFDAKICDFLTPAINISDMSDWVLFQHNVETMIWERHALTGRTPLHRAYFGLQAKRMLQWESKICRTAAHVVAVSEADEHTMRERFGISNTSAVATGVDLDYFERPAHAALDHELVFVGSMDWMPNIDGIQWFLKDVLPLIHAQRPDCRLAIVGRNPPESLREAAKNARVVVTGTVPDVRPYVWGASVAIVPLRIGGGTRLKIYESMAAGTPVVSTTIGAEGLPVRPDEHICIADSAEEFANRCLALLASSQMRQSISGNALELIRSRFSWEQVVEQFEQTLRSAKPTTRESA